MLKIEGLVHFTIPVKDLNRAQAFYTEVLGMEEVRRNPHMVFMKTGSDFFVLTYSEKPVDPNPGDTHDIHTAFRVSAEEYDRGVSFLKSKGIKVFMEEDRNTGTFRGRSAYFHDPDRNVIEIIEVRMDPMLAVAEERERAKAKQKV